MKLTMAVLAAALCLNVSPSLASNNQVRMNIVGGTEAAQGEFPFIVSIQMNGFGHFCGGSLIKKNWVLTAAHCVSNTIDHVMIGMHNLKDTSNVESHTVKRVIAHPQYNENSTDYDFALLELSEESNYEPIALNTTDIQVPMTGAPILATVAGWGVTEEGAFTLPDLLQKVEVPLVSKDVCSTDYPGSITDRMICAGYAQGGKDSCQGDSGGPLIANADNNQRYLIGVVSWGEGCAQAGKPGIYSKVSSAVSWINQTAN